MTAQEEQTMLRYLTSIDGRVSKLNEKVDILTDKLNGYHGDTVSTDECTKCQGRWVSKRELLLVGSVLGALEPVVIAAAVIIAQQWLGR
jgi:hypothetical protein